MSYAAHLIHDYQARTGQPRDGALDAVYQLQWTYLRDMLGRLEVILDDEDVPPEIAKRVLRCLLYGSPSPADAEYRMRQQEETVKLLSERATVMVTPRSIFEQLGLPEPPSGIGVTKV